MPLLRVVGLVSIHLLLVPGAFAGQDRDPCLSRVPTALAKALLTKYPEFRLPLTKDGEPTQVEFSRKHGHSECVLVTTGDFDGTSQCGRGNT